MKKIFLGLIVIIILLSITPPTFAITTTPLGREIKNTIRETVDEGQEEGSSTAKIRKEVRENIKDDIKEVRMGFLGKVKNFLKKNLRFEARVKGSITQIGSASFSMTSEDGTFQINVTEKTNLLRKFGGKSSLSEYAVGDEVVVFGKFTDEKKTAIDAKTIKNNSIQKRFGAFFGKVTAKNSDNFVMETAERGAQTVYVGTAKIVNRKEVTIALADIKVGDRVRVKGIWDKTLNKISEVIQIKDFSIPAIVPTQAAND